MYELKPFDSLHLGQTVSVRKTITEADGALYIAATGDFGPVHVDDSYAQTTRFGQRLAPGILVAGICTSVLTAELAGTLGISIEDRFWFTGPVFYGDTIEFKVWIAQMNAETRSVIWQASATNADGKEVLKAEATLKFPRVKPKVAA
ncbi:MaoC family dehydratase [Variovorax arabinosiphilus]|jgi:3-hydroxybutyryl-CoA dehydratase|uniref:MaoC family dehydratase n=1 Tax=Variovorax arabinosiphilus TaxID=3053498 RepID=UPI002575691C|nr:MULTISPECIES: MaoC/PaaZ C-terminal domain-containing protein [unclassified Variovorax]MDM0119769.1 MaoC/PaaZ C-terminal domain-containing protein [Variovorax sp. J2L1-78]MDM0128319.1 MaoC/PaaZ C-terminal domain-containing protein [Variovorax sp. J2L1-63]MDM0232019.1 MaoC/PaaZ C-terminal domain-containing protein [Variovorax sp. J2R1-6]